MTDQSFMKALFHGVIAEDLVFPYPEPPETEREAVRAMLTAVQRFGKTVDSAAIDAAEALPDEVLRDAKTLGLFGLVVPDEYGGLGLSTMGYARIMEEVASIDASLAVTLGGHQSIGLRGLLLFGTAEQRRRYLPRLATGEQIAAFALTEPSAGSDAAAIRTRADRSADGQHYTLNGSKIWTTNGAFADLFTVFARTSAPGEGHKPRLTAFLVERGHGVRSGPDEHKLGIRGSSTTSLFFDDVRVPAENVLGEPGRGFRVAMEVLNVGRLSLATSSVGACKRLIQMSIERAMERKAFGRNIGEFGLIKDKIAAMTSQTWALESVAYLTAGSIDRAEIDCSLESAICKVVGSETLWRVANEALQIAAGIGYMRDYPYERLLRDARVNLIFEGTNEILRCFVALSGMASPGKELSEVSKAMREPIKGFGLLSEFAVRKARTALGRERLSRAHPLLSREAVLFEEYTGELSRAVERVLRKHGREIAEMQYVQRRVADVAMDLYAIAACVARTTRAIERRGVEGARREIDLTTMFAASAHTRMKNVIAAFERNDDELRKDIAARAYSDGRYPFDVYLRGDRHEGPLPGLLARARALPTGGDRDVRPIEEEAPVLGRDVHAAGALRHPEILVPVRRVDGERRPEVLCVGDVREPELLGIAGLGGHRGRAGLPGDPVEPERGGRILDEHGVRRVPRGDAPRARGLQRRVDGRLALVRDERARPELHLDPSIRLRDARGGRVSCARHRDLSLADPEPCASRRHEALLADDGDGFAERDGCARREHFAARSERAVLTPPPERDTVVAGPGERELRVAAEPEAAKPRGPKGAHAIRRDDGELRRWRQEPHPPAVREGVREREHRSRGDPLADEPPILAPRRRQAAPVLDRLGHGVRRLDAARLVAGELLVAARPVPELRRRRPRTARPLDLLLLLERREPRVHRRVHRERVAEGHHVRAVLRREGLRAPERIARSPRRVIAADVAVRGHLDPARGAARGPHAFAQDDDARALPHVADLPRALRRLGEDPGDVRDAPDPRSRVDGRGRLGLRDRGHAVLVDDEGRRGLLAMRDALVPGCDRDRGHDQAPVLVRARGDEQGEHEEAAHGATTNHRNRPDASARGAHPERAARSEDNAFSAAAGSALGALRSSAAWSPMRFRPRRDIFSFFGGAARDSWRLRTFQIA